MNIESQIKKAVTEALTEFFQNQSQCDKPVKAKSDSPKPKDSPKSEAPKQPDSPKPEEAKVLVDIKLLKQAAPKWVSKHSMDEFVALLAEDYNATSLSTVLEKDRNRLLDVLTA